MRRHQRITSTKVKRESVLSRGMSVRPAATSAIKPESSRVYEAMPFQGTNLQETGRRSGWRPSGRPSATSSPRTVLTSYFEGQIFLGFTSILYDLGSAFVY